MVPNFDDMFNSLRNSEDFGKNHPLKEFGELAQGIQEEILQKARNKFDYSQHGKEDFYGYLFDELHNAGVSTSTGVEASLMSAIHTKACKYFPKYRELSVYDQFNLMRGVVKKVTRNQNRAVYAMNMYYALVEADLDEFLEIHKTDPFSYGTSGGAIFKQGVYKKTYTSYKDLKDADNGKVYKKNVPTWVSYKSTWNCPEFTKTILCCDLWYLLAEQNAYYPKQEH